MASSHDRSDINVGCIRSSNENGRVARNSSWKAEPTEDRLQAGVGAKRVEHRIDIEEDDPVGSLVAGGVQPGKGFALLIQSDVNGCNAVGRHVPPPGQPFEL